VLTVYLGNWQQGRAAEKRGLQAQFDVRVGEPPVLLDSRSRDMELRYRQAVAEGEWLVAKQIYVDNKVNHEVAGYHVITHAAEAGQASGTYVLVNRGWIPRGPILSAALLWVEVPSGHVRITGQLSVPTSRFPGVVGAVDPR